MGRVVKGAQVAQQTYQLKPPPANGARHSAFAPLEEDPLFAQGLHDLTFSEAAPPPSIDFEALRAEAEQLVEDASRDAQALVRDAQARAVALLEDAERRVAQIEGEAKNRGLEQGVADGRAAAQAEMDEMLETMRGLVQMALAERHKIIETAEPEIVRLSVAVAERILNQHIALDPHTVLEMVKSAVMRLVNREKVTVRVNPSDIEIMRSQREQLMAMNDIDNMRIIEDQRVDRGGIVIDTDAGTIDSKISTQLREVRRLLAVDDSLTVPASAGPALVNPPAQAS